MSMACPPPERKDSHKPLRNGDIGNYNDGRKVKMNDEKTPI